MTSLQLLASFVGRCRRRCRGGAWDWLIPVGLQTTPVQGKEGVVVEAPSGEGRAKDKTGKTMSSKSMSRPAGGQNRSVELLQIPDPKDGS